MGSLLLPLPATLSLSDKEINKIFKKKKKKKRSTEKNYLLSKLSSFKSALQKSLTILHTHTEAHTKEQTFWK